LHFGHSGLKDPGITTIKHVNLNTATVATEIWTLLQQVYNLKVLNIGQVYSVEHSAFIIYQVRKYMDSATIPTGFALLLPLDFKNILCLIIAEIRRKSTGHKMCFICIEL
jgi:hypothetical protein